MREVQSEIPTPFRNELFVIHARNVPLTENRNAGAYCLVALGKNVLLFAITWSLRPEAPWGGHSAHLER